jgi:hypothetical protein
MEILKKWALSTLRVLNSGARATPSLQARLKNVVQRYNTRGAIYRALVVVLMRWLGAMNRTPTGQLHYIEAVLI